MLDQMLLVLQKLKDSWQLAKSVYADEAMETQLFKIKLWRIFVFDFVLVKKPLFPNWKSKKKAKKEEKKAQAKEKEEEELGKIEKNKYVLFDSTKTVFSRHSTKPVDFKNKKLDYVSSKLKLEISKVFEEFTNYNLKMWVDIGDILMQVRRAADYLEAQTEN